MFNIIYTFYIALGISCLIVAICFYLFRIYPKWKKFLREVKREFKLEGKENKLKGFYRDREITLLLRMGATGKNSWILIKFSKPTKFRAKLSLKKPYLERSIFTVKPLGKELFTGQPAFDSKFQIIGVPTFPVKEVFNSSIQKKFFQLAERCVFEIQILENGISFLIEKDFKTVYKVRFVLDLLVEISEIIEKI